MAQETLTGSERWEIINHGFVIVVVLIVVVVCLVCHVTFAV